MRIVLLCVWITRYELNVLDVSFSSRGRRPCVGRNDVVTRRSKAADAVAQPTRRAPRVVARCDQYRVRCRVVNCPRLTYRAVLLCHGCLCSVCVVVAAVGDCEGTRCVVCWGCVALLTSGLRLQFSRWHGLCIGHRLPASVQAGVADCCSIFPCVDAIANSSLRRQGACGAVPSSPTTGGKGRARCRATGCGAGTGACRWHRCPSCQ